MCGAHVFHAPCGELETKVVRHVGGHHGEAVAERSGDPLSVFQVVTVSTPGHAVSLAEDSPGRGVENLGKRPPHEGELANGLLRQDGARRVSEEQPGNARTRDAEPVPDAEGHVRGTQRRRPRVRNVFPQSRCIL